MAQNAAPVNSNGNEAIKTVTNNGPVQGTYGTYGGGGGGGGGGATAQTNVAGGAADPLTSAQDVLLLQYKIGTNKSWKEIALEFGKHVNVVKERWNEIKPKDFNPPQNQNKGGAKQQNHASGYGGSNEADNTKNAVKANEGKKRDKGDEDKKEKRSKKKHDDDEEKHKKKEKDKKKKHKHDKDESKSSKKDKKKKKYRKEDSDTESDTESEDEEDRKKRERRERRKKAKEVR
jgi:hypothetical protein